MTITASDGTAIAMRLTDRNGLIPPIEIPAPDESAGLTPDSGVVPYTAVDLYAGLAGYEQIETNAVQIFPDTVTTQNFELIPNAELPDSFTRFEQFATPPQNL